MNRRIALLSVWLLTDLAVFLGAFSLAYFVRVGWIFSSDFPFNNFMMVAALAAPVWLSILVATRTFALMRKQASFRTLSYLLYAAVVATAFFALGYYFFYGLFFSRLLLLQAFVFIVVFSFAWHLVFGAFSRGLLRGDHPSYPTLIIGATREAAELIRSLNQSLSPLTPVAVLDGRGTKETSVEGVPVMGKLNKLEDVLKEYGVTHLVQCSDLEQSINLLSACRSHGITYLLLPSVLGIVERDERIESLEGRPVTVVRPSEPKWKWFFS